MSAFDRALTRRSQEPGQLPEDIAGAADWLTPEEGEGPRAPAAFLDRFSSETAAAPPARPAAADAGVANPEVEADDAVEADGSAEIPDGWPRFAAEPARDAAVATPPERSDSMVLFNGFHPGAAGKVVAGPEMDYGTAEQYGRLAAVLHYAQIERGIKKVMVTSAVAGEGKTLTAINLALTLSESYQRRVSFIDADLRRSCVHELLNVTKVTGLSEALHDGGLVQARLLEVSPRLSVLLAGCADLDPKGALTSRRMAQVLEEAAAISDWVIVDTPPVVLLPDTHLLARMVDAAIVVVRAGSTGYDAVDRAIQTLDRKRVLGIVLNRAEDAEALQYYYPDDRATTVER
jgi:capsular exopolysaccharide synthesis family protein